MAKDKDKRDKEIERLRQELEEALRSRAEAESKLLDQSARLASLGSGREETMRVLGETRAELRRVAAERDRLQKELVSIEGMQTETAALPDDYDEEGGDATAEATGGHIPSPSSIVQSIDELMSNLNAMIEDDASSGRSQLSGLSTEQPEAQWEEMLAPEVIAPEEFGGDGDHASARRAKGQRSRLLVFSDAAQSIKYPIYKEVMTIGRSESADIQIDGDYMSRIHARIVSAPTGAYIEDAGSKNGIKVNFEPVERCDLQHGDVISIGELRFTFVETSRG